jgi:YD repeat-containing protein
MNRVVRNINTDGSDSPTLNDSDVLITYEGCGCAGGVVTTVESELVPIPGTTNFARRKQKEHTDILGRAFKMETFEWNGMTIYSSIVNTYNGRDQVTLSRHYAGSTTSSTYQDTTATFDGHGRMTTSHKPEQRDGSTLKYTTYNYNLDGSVSDMTDGRGVVTSHTYNSRGLVTNVGWTVPGGSGISDPTDVVVAYDNVGNRTSMTDGLGEVDYEYNSLSQLTAETRDFTDTLSNAPTGEVFRLEYAYNLSG